MGPKWILGIIMFFLICTLISNVIEKQEIYTTTQIANVQAMRGQTLTEAKEPDLGGVTTTGMNPLSVLDAIWSAIKLDYSFLYDISYTTSEVDCGAITGAKWQTSISACQMPNGWWPLWLILVYGPMVAIAFYLKIQ